MKKNLHIESFLVLMLTLLVIGGLYLLSLNVNLFNVLKKSYKKIDLYDLYYAQIKSKEAGFSNEIVLVNIGNHSRGEIAEILNSINQENPKVIGLDIYFEGFQGNQEDSLLYKSLTKVKEKLVLIHNLYEPKQTYNLAFQLDSIPKGFANFIGNKEGETIRKTHLKYQTEDKKSFNSFAYEVAKKYNPDLVNLIDEKCEQDNNPFIINYSGGYNRFYPIEGKELLSESKSFPQIKDKIVIVGYFGNTFNEIKPTEDLHFTPLNESGGYGKPDMHGALIHANIVQMILDKSYIQYYKSSQFVVMLLSIIFAFPIVVLFTYYFVRRHLWYHVVAKICQLLLGIGFIFITLNLYEHVKIKLDIKFFLLIIAVAVDVLYLYEAIATFIYKKYGKKSYFIHTH